MIQILKMTQTELKDYLDAELRLFGYKPVYMDGFLYAEGNIPVGLVAHMDTVFAPPKFVEYKNGIMEGKSGLGADDRAGIYGILHIIRNGLRPTVMFMEDEEKGCIGAEKFVKANIKLNLNYLIELDRQGSNDSVFYDCNNYDFERFVNSFGFDTAFGSFSDISEIAPHYGISAVNLSVGYYGQHTIHEILIIGELANTLKRVEEMLKAKTSKFVYIPFDYSSKKYTKAWLKGGYYWKDYDDEKDYGYSSKATSKYYGNVNMNKDPDLAELYKCILVRATGEIVEVETVGDYFIDINDQVFNAWGDWVDAYVTDYNFEKYLTFADFI